MQISVSYPVLPTDTEELIQEKEYQSLLEMFNYLIQLGCIKRTEGHDFYNGGFIKKVNLSLTLPEELETVEVSATVVEHLPNEPLDKGCTSCSN